MTGETLKIFASGNQFKISAMMHGQADALVRVFHAAKQPPTDQAALAPLLRGYRQIIRNASVPSVRLQHLTAAMLGTCVRPWEGNAKASDLLPRSPACFDVSEGAVKPFDADP
jgi:hypothetical protein